MMTTGIVLTASSLPFALIAASLSTSAYADCVSDLPADHIGTAAQVEQGNDCRASRKTRSAAIVVSTLVMVGVGIPLIVVGAKKVPDAEQATLTPWVSPTAAGATLRLSL
jgi:hypothetical protein